MELIEPKAPLLAHGYWGALYKCWNTIPYLNRCIHSFIHSIIQSFIHSGYFYSTSSSPLLLRGTPEYSIDAESELTRRIAAGNCEWQLQWDSNLRPSGRKAQNLPLSHHAHSVKYEHEHAKHAWHNRWHLPKQLIASFYILCSMATSKKNQIPSMTPSKESVAMVKQIFPISC